MKTCKDCKAQKDVSDFGRQTREKDGLAPFCKACAKVRRESYKLIPIATFDKWKERARVVDSY
jgi:hypothetical protein